MAVIVDHVLVSHPHHLPLLRIAQLAVGRSRPPVGRGVGRAIRSAALPIPRTSPQIHLLVSRRERSPLPVDLHPPSLGRPAVAIPDAGVSLHRLLVRIGNSILFVVSENPDRDAIDQPSIPEYSSIG